MNCHREKFLQLLSEIAKGGTRYTVFNDFCKISAISIANKIDFNQRRENLYLETIKKYDRDAVSKFCEMFCELLYELEDCIAEKVLDVNCPPLENEGLKLQFPLKGKPPQYVDVLGEIFTEFNLTDIKDGQVFTPMRIGEVMGALTLDEDYVWQEIKRQGFVLIKENCCGSGALTLGALNQLLKLKVSPNHQTLVIASDIDERCVHMCYIQLSLYGIPAVVLQQNDVSDEVYAEWYTPLFKRNPLFDKLDWRRL